MLFASIVYSLGPVSLAERREVRHYPQPGVKRVVGAHVSRAHGLVDPHRSHVVVLGLRLGDLASGVIGRGERADQAGIGAGLVVTAGPKASGPQLHAANRRGRLDTPRARPAVNAAVAVVGHDHPIGHTARAALPGPFQVELAGPVRRQMRIQMEPTSKAGIRGLGNREQLVDVARLQRAHPADLPDRSGRVAVRVSEVSDEGVHEPEATGFERRHIVHVGDVGLRRHVAITCRAQALETRLHQCR